MVIKKKKKSLSLSTKWVFISNLVSAEKKFRDSVLEEGQHWLRGSATSMKLVCLQQTCFTHKSWGDPTPHGLEWMGPIASLGKTV